MTETTILDDRAVTWTKEFPSLKYGTWFWLREGPSGTPELRQITGGRSWLEAFGMVSDTTEFLGPVRPSDLERIHTLQSQLEQLRAENEALRKEVANSGKYQAQLLDSDSQVETLHYFKDRGDGRCVICGNLRLWQFHVDEEIDPATAMRDKCVKKVRVVV